MLEDWADRSAGDGFMASYLRKLRGGVCLLTAMGCGLLLLAGSCVRAGAIDPSIIARYQQAMARLGPQVRAETGPLKDYLPAAGETGPVLKVTKDDDGKEIVLLSLQEAIMRGLANNLDIRVVSYTPEISYQEMVEAAAEFDYVIFGGASMTKTDEILSLAGLAGLRNDRRTQEGEVGIRQKTVTGANWSLTYGLDHERDRSTSATTPSWTPLVSLSVTQPLLRGGWSERNLASLRISRINRNTTLSQFRQQVELTVTQIITAYWQLVQTRREVEIQEALMEASLKTLQRIQDRMDLDATAVQIKQTEAAVEQRRAVLIQAENAVGDAQDTLGRLLADPIVNSLTDAEVIPTDKPAEIAVTINEMDQLVTALRYNPVLEQARLAIATADINVKVAENDKLPRLDFTATTEVQGRGRSFHGGRKRMESFDQTSWSLALTFEYPLGNRERESVHRQRRYERLRAITDLQNQVDQVSLIVRERIREVRTAFREISIQGVAVEAATAQLQALEDTERIRGALTPEFLQVKLSAQDTLAAAHRDLIRAIVTYNVAMVEVNQATGTVLEMSGVKVAVPIAQGAAPWPQPQASRP
ncbi:hypothetical protein LCGC14_0340150 [marine sediment metagenome]|uniref:TolC family protein n=1 Tax=marine sediment metagenome TaxID=412755 RepID=A0A0F9WLK6_9ZZZZ|nr:TolC family protein [Phycisphaerae bacterium]HDZ44574.1 TolC family protein [Phycisphaerae bacterium]